MNIISVLREYRSAVVIIVLFFIVVFHHNPSFSMLGPNIIARHETGPKQVALNDS
jgi:hypothetical protein